jgi:hypothetical protein
LHVLDADILHVQVRGEGGVRVGAGVDRAIIIIVLGDHNPLGNDELLFQVMGDGILRLPSEDGGALVRLGIVQGLACGIHGGDESLLLSVRGSGGGLSHDHDVILLRLSDVDSRDGDILLLVDGGVGGAAQHGQQDGDG